MSWVGCYSLDLYCDNYKGGRDEIHGWGNFPVQYTAERGGDCRAQARAAGWRLGRDCSAICPKCVAAGRRLSTIIADKR